MNILPFFANMGQTAIAGTSGTGASGATSSGSSFAAMLGTSVKGTLGAKSAATAAAATAQGSQTDASDQDALLIAALKKGISRLTGKQELPVQNLTLSDEELGQVREALAGLGLPEADIDELTEKYGGQGWVDFLQRMELALGRLRERSPGVCLTCEERSRVQTLFEKMGFSASEANGLMEDVRSGKFEKVLSAVQERLKTLADDETISLDGADLTLLGQYMRLPAEDAEQLGQIVGQAGRTEFSASEVKAAMSLLQNAVVSEKENIGQATLNFRLTMARILDDALTRSTGEGLVDSDAKKLILADADKQAAKAMGLKVGAGKDEEAAQADSLLAKTKSQNAQAGTDPNQLLARNAAQAAGEKSGGNGEKPEDPWQSFWERMTRGNAQTTDGGLAAETQAFVKAQAGADASQTQAQTQTTPKTAYTPQDVLNQVETGIYKSLGEGKTQLSLRLDPPELGSLHILLQVKGNELKAVVSTDNADTTRILSEQMVQVREHLEAQGIKVSELEVQTGLPQDAQTRNWQGTTEHNQSQEEAEMNLMRQRLRNLRGALTDSGGVLAAEAAVAARTSATGLDLFA